MSDRKIAFWFIALLSVLVLVPFLGETIFYSKAGQFHFKLFIHGFLLFILSSFYMSRTICSETTEKCTIL